MGRCSAPARLDRRRPRPLLPPPRRGRLAVDPAAMGSALGLGYPLTVPRARGSEHDEVLLLLPDYACPLVTRELVYTAVSRARAAVVVCGSLDILAAGIATRAERGSGIAERLAGARGGP